MSSDEGCRSYSLAPRTNSSSVNSSAYPSSATPRSLDDPNTALTTSSAPVRPWKVYRPEALHDVPLAAAEDVLPVPNESLEPTASPQTVVVLHVFRMCLAQNDVR